MRQYGEVQETKQPIFISTDAIQSAPGYQTRPNHILVLPILEANLGMGSPTLPKILGRVGSDLHIKRLAQPKEIKVSDKEIQQSLEEARQKGRDKVITIKST
jgi:hypothetical protein